MTKIVEHVELDGTNIKFNYALDFVKHTNKLVYLTGKAGTGRTTFLKYLKNTTEKNTVILAPTGVAAVNAGGQTIHSFFKINPSVYIPNDKRLRDKVNPNDNDRSNIYDYFKYSTERIEIIQNLELLIIDEISMVRCDLLDVIDNLLRVFRKRHDELFGGVQVILIGDLFQLAPIANFDEWVILHPFYKNRFFFSSNVIRNNKPVYIELKKIYRQNEKEFIDLLNKIRVNQVTSNEFSLLNSKYNPTFSADGTSNYITISTHKDLVEATNFTKLNELNTTLNLFEATIVGLFPDSIMPTDKVLHLKEGAQVMFIKNDKSKRYYNGKIGKLKTIDDNKIMIEISEGNEINVEKQTWYNIKYIWNEKEKKIEEEIIGVFTQYPLRLAWAITVNKSQGLAFEHVIADLGAAFASGQVYVALSRCTTFSGLVLKSKIEQKAIMIDPQVLEFAQNETPETLILQELNSGRADFYYKKVREGIKSQFFLEAYYNFIKAIKFRNDIETDVFRRLFTTTARRLSLYKQKYISSQIKLEELAEEIFKNKAELKNLNKINEKKIIKISELNKGLKLVLDETERLSKKNSSLIMDMDVTLSTLNIIQKQYESIQTQHSEAINTIEKKNYLLKLQEETLRKLRRDIEINKEMINDQKELLENLNIENNRLKKLRWYHKLIGKE